MGHKRIYNDWGAFPEMLDTIMRPSKELIQGDPHINAYLTASQVKKYCRLFRIKISNNPSYFELQEAANQIGQRFQAMSDEAFNIKPMK